MVKADVGDNGGLTLDKSFYVEFAKGYRSHEIVSTATTAHRTLPLSVCVSVQAADWTETGLWLAEVASGVYHGLNPGMGWPLAVSAGLMGKGRRDLIASLGPLPDTSWRWPASWRLLPL